MVLLSLATMPRKPEQPPRKIHSGHAARVSFGKFISFGIRSSLRRHATFISCACRTRKLDISVASRNFSASANFFCGDALLGEFQQPRDGQRLPS